MLAAWMLFSAFAMPRPPAPLPSPSPSPLKVYTLTYGDSKSVCAILNQLRAMSVRHPSKTQFMPPSYLFTQYRLPPAYIAIDSRTIVVGGPEESLRLADDWVRIFDVGSRKPVLHTDTAAFISMKYESPETLVRLAKELGLKIKAAPVPNTSGLVVTGDSEALRQLEVLGRYFDREPVFRGFGFGGSYLWR